MNHRNQSDSSKEQERLLELLLLEQAGELPAEQERELEHLLGEGGPGAAGLDPEQLRLAVAAAANAGLLEGAEPAPEPMPAGLVERLEADAAQFFASHRSAASGAGAKAGSDREASSGKPASGVVAFRDRARQPADSAPSAMAGGPARSAAWLGWAVAASLALTLVWTQLGQDRGSGAGAASAPLAVESAPSTGAGSGPGDAGGALAERFRELAAATDSSRTPWSLPGNADFAAVRGEVLWNDRLQQGFLRLEGMPVNDPERHQYQLWIVDPLRDARPVDGGVFDIRVEGETLIPIRAALPVEDPQLFAITREKPGGVVVSDGPLLVVARPG